MLFFYLYLNSLSQHFGEAESSDGAGQSPATDRPPPLRLAAVNGHRLLADEFVPASPALPPATPALRLIAENGVRLA